MRASGSPATHPILFRATPPTRHRTVTHVVTHFWHQCECGIVVTHSDSRCACDTMPEVSHAFCQMPMGIDRPSKVMFTRRCSATPLGKHVLHASCYATPTQEFEMEFQSSSSIFFWLISYISYRFI